MLAISGALLTVAALVRIWLTIREPTSWRIALTVAMVFLALAVLANANLAAVDAVTVPNFSRLAVHLCLAASGGAVFVYVALLKSDSLSARRLAAYVAPTLVVCAGLAVAWAHSNLPGHTVVDLNPWAREPGFFAEQATIYTWLIVCLGTTAHFCLRNARSGEEDLTRLIGLNLIGTGCALGAAAFAISVSYNTDQYLTGHYPILLDHLDSEVILPVALLMLAAGLFTMIVMPRLEPSVRARRRLRALRPLHAHLTRLHPEVTLPTASRSPRVLEQRAVIEIHDALTRVQLDPHTLAGIEPVALALRSPVTKGIAAADRLPPTDLGVLIALATAFTKTAERTPDSCIRPGANASQT